MVNTYPYVLMTRALLPLLRKRKGSNTLIVNVSSSASFQPLPFQNVYACTKVFDRFFSVALQTELTQAAHNIEVLTICPFHVQTGMTLNMEPSWTSGVTSCRQYVDSMLRAMASPTPVGVFVGPP
jgi:uncharacterized protein